MAQNIIDQLPEWKYASVFDHKQKLVLQWAESITRMPPDLHELKTQLGVHFNEKELVDLTASISLMNALNRLRITLGDKH